MSIDQAGTAVYAVTTTNPFGTNPDYRKQIVRWDAVTGIGAPITNYEEGVESVSVSNDGTWISFVSAADPLGTNHDENPELFVMHPDETGLVQLTNFGTYEEIRAAVLSGSASRVAFIGNITPLGTNPTYANALVVIDRNGSTLRQFAADTPFPRAPRPGKRSSTCIAAPSGSTRPRDRTGRGAAARSASPGQEIAPPSRWRPMGIGS